MDGWAGGKIEIDALSQLNLVRVAALAVLGNIKTTKIMRLLTIDCDDMKNN